MILDRDCNVVFTADSLEPRFPEIHRALGAILGEHGVPLRTIPGTLDVWCRDYMPVQTAEGRFVQFRYEPDYLTGKHRRLRADGEIGSNTPWLRECSRSRIVLDGGNVVAWNDRAIFADKIFRENPGLNEEAVVEALKTELALSVLIVVPREPYDPIGHSDWMACWLNERTVLINGYATVGERFRRRVRACFDRREMDVIELPYEPRPGGSRGIPTAAGNWMNFLQIRDVVIVPTFGLRGDRPALDVLKAVHPGHTIESVDCRALALEGGLLHCVTWQAIL